MTTTKNVAVVVKTNRKTVDVVVTHKSWHGDWRNGNGWTDEHATEVRINREWLAIHGLTAEEAAMAHVAKSTINFAGF